MPNYRRTFSSALFLPLAVMACDGGSSERSADDEVPSVLDTCEEDASLFEAVTVAETNIATVFEVSWQSTEAVAARVAFAFDSDGAHETPASETGQSAAVDVLGVPASTEVRFRVVDGQNRCSPEQSTTTGALSETLPLLSVTGSGEEDLGYVSVPIIGAETYHLAIIDGKGRYVWAFERIGMPWRMEFARDGESILVNTQAGTAEGAGHIVRYNMRGEEVASYSAPGIHTDFVEGPDGTLYAPGWDIRSFQHEGVERKILGDTIVAIDPDTGNHREIFNVFEHWSPDLSEDLDQGVYADDPSVEDWSHINGLSFDDTNDALLVSVAGLQAVVSLDASTGELQWAVGDVPQSVDYDHAQMLISNPHSVYRSAEDELVVFNRNSFGGTECSDVVWLDVDTAAQTAELADTFVSEDCLSVYFLGMARPVADDRTLVAWTTSGRVDQVDSDGELVWSVTADLGAGMGYSDHRSSLYR